MKLSVISRLGATKQHLPVKSCARSFQVTSNALVTGEIFCFLFPSKFMSFGTAWAGSWRGSRRRPEDVLARTLATGHAALPPMGLRPWGGVAAGQRLSGRLHGRRPISAGGGRAAPPCRAGACLLPVTSSPFGRRRYLRDIHLPWPCNPPRLLKFLAWEIVWFPGI